MPHPPSRSKPKSSLPFIISLFLFLLCSPFIYTEYKQIAERRRLEHERRQAEIKRDLEIERNATGIIEDWNHLEIPREDFPEEIINEENLAEFRSKAFLRESTSSFEAYTVQHRLYIYSRGIPKKSINEINFGMTINERQESIVNLLHVAASWMKGHNLTFWLTHGTLIGSMRNKGIIPWDLDADIAIDYDSYTAISRIAGKNLDAKPSEIFLSEDIQLIIRADTSAHVIPFRLCNTTSGVYIDFFLFWRTEKSHVFAWPYKCKMCFYHPFGWYEVFNWMLYPLQQCEFEGRLYPCPAQPESYLNEWYSELSPPVQLVRLYLKSLRRIDWDGPSPQQKRQKRLKEIYESFPEARAWKDFI